MDVKRLPWVTGMMRDLGLEDQGGGFWTSPDGGRSVYLGQGSAMVTTTVGDQDFQTGYRYPTFPDETWLLDCIEQHQLEILMQARETDPALN